MAKYSKRPDGRYSTNIDIGRTADGKRIRKTLYAKTIKEMDEKILAFKTNPVFKSSDTSLYDYALSWYDTYKSLKSINTKAMYMNILNAHIKPTIGDIPIGKITKSDIQKLINDKSQAVETCKKIRLTLKQIFEAAIEDDIISKNPALNVTLPAKTNNSKRTLKENEKRAILCADFDDMQKAFVYILYFCGLRREEALALTIADIDLKKSEVSVSKAVVFDKNTPIISPTKNISSVRRVPLPSEAYEFISYYVNNICSLYLFTKHNGDLITHSSYVKFWKSIIKTMNLAIMTDKQKDIYFDHTIPPHLRESCLPITDLTAHIFRHNYATMLYYSGISIKKAAALLGHSNTNMIMQVYAHLDDEKEQTVDKLNNMIKLAK